MTTQRTLVEPPCTGKTHAWSVLQKLPDGSWFFDCNRRDCRVRKFVRDGGDHFVILGYQEYSDDHTTHG